MQSSSSKIAATVAPARVGFIPSVILAASLMAGFSEACVQVDLVSIANTNGQITDYQTPQDELSVWMGVDEDILYTWENTMTPW